MDTQELSQNIARVEECVDEAKNAAQGGNVPQDLRSCIDELHQQARSAKHAGPQAGTDQLRQAVMQIEQTADRAMDACRRAGSAVDPRLQQALQRAHAEASRLKKQVEADALS